MNVDILVGDVRDRLRGIPDKSARCSITSPPYFGLRDYGVAGQLGLEESPAEYVATLVEVFREVRRVLTDDGTLWLNLGDSYAGSWGAQGREGPPSKNRYNERTEPRHQIENHPKRARFTGNARAAGVKSKDLYGIPWRVAFALQADGWWLRQDTIWSNPNPMPESVTDRCTKAHEYLFMLTKSERYLFNAKAIAEPVTESTLVRTSQATLEEQYGSDRVPGKTNGPIKAKPPKDELRNKRSVWTVPTVPFIGEFCRSCRVFFAGADLAELKVERVKIAGRETRIRHCRCGKIDQWLSHFATFPPDLITPCVLASSNEGDTILDPFGGAGTTALVANRHHRNAVLIDLNPDYAEMTRQRIVRDAGIMARVELAA